MNDKQRAIELKRQIDTTQGWHKFSCLRFHAESDEHRKAKFDKCVELFNLGHEFATEVKLKSGKIADVIDFTDGLIYEFELNKKVDKHRGVRVQL